MNRDVETVDAYLATLPPDRREALEAVRAVILENLDPRLEEGMQYGMIGYYVPHSVFPEGYHCDPKQPLPYAGIASQKNHMSLYLMCGYVDPSTESWFQEAWKATGKKLDMGKACVRFKRLEDVPLEVLGEMIRRTSAAKFIGQYQAQRAEAQARKPAPRKAPARKARPTAKSPARKAATPGKPTARKAAPARKAAAEAPSTQGKASSKRT